MATRADPFATGSHWGWTVAAGATLAACGTVIVSAVVYAVWHFTPRSITRSPLGSAARKRCVRLHDESEIDLDSIQDGGTVEMTSQAASGHPNTTEWEDPAARQPSELRPSPELIAIGNVCSRALLLMLLGAVLLLVSAIELSSGPIPPSSLLPQMPRHPSPPARTLPPSTEATLPSLASPLSSSQPMRPPRSLSPPSPTPPPPSPAVPPRWLAGSARVRGVTCDGEAAQEVRPGWAHMGTRACYELCRQEAGCQGVIARAQSSDDVPTDCWFRKEIDITRCEEDSDFVVLYDTSYYSPSPALFAYLNESYSAALYGAPGKLDPHFRLIWPSLLPQVALDLVWMRCTLPISAQEEQLSFAYPWPNHHFMQHAALFLYRPRHELTFTIADYQWVEVTHCSYSHGVTDATPMYFFHLPGSGLFLNVGRSLRLRQVQDDDDDPHFAVHRAIDRGDFETAELLLGMGLSAYDSVQYPLYTTEAWRGQMLTEIAMLKWHNERDHITSRLTDLRCGARDALRACREDDVAVSQMVGICNGPSAPSSIATLRSKSKCADIDPSNGEHVDINGLEVDEDEDD